MFGHNAAWAAREIGEEVLGDTERAKPVDPSLRHRAAEAALV
jgi:hypothetical protein